MGVTSANANGGVLQLKSGITFPSTAVLSTDANTLDDYEEGTWAPAFGGTTSNPTVTYVYQDGWYVKIGKLVYVWAILTTSAVSGGSGNLTIINIPFQLDPAGYYQIHRLLLGEAQDMNAPAISSILTSEEQSTTQFYTDVTTASLKNASNANRIRFNGWYVTNV